MAVTTMGNLIDMNSALSRVGGNSKLLHTLLKKFAKETYFEQLKRDITGNDLAAAAITAHTLKGVASNLSLVGLYTMIVELEQQLKRGVCEESTFRETERVYQETIATIDQTT